MPGIIVQAVIVAGVAVEQEVGIADKAQAITYLLANFSR